MLLVVLKTKIRRKTADFGLSVAYLRLSRVVRVSSLSGVTLKVVLVSPYVGMGTLVFVYYGELLDICVSFLMFIISVICLIRWLSRRTR